MKPILAFTIILLLPLSIIAQSKKWAPNEVYLQSRMLHQPKSYSSPEFSTNYDFTLGTNWTKTLGEKFTLKLGAAINTSQHSRKDFDPDAIYYQDKFKGSEISYYNFKDINQFNLETPIQLEYTLKQAEKIQYTLFAGLTPQFLLYSKAKGNGFWEKTSGNFVFDPNADRLIAAPRFSAAFLNEMYATAGLGAYKKLGNGKSIGLNLGYEYAPKSASSGSFLKLVFRF
ncbi:MAG: hypothetical protein ACPGLV_01690 [Bacteroidia bacterium]